MKIRQLFEAIEDKLEVAKLPYKTGDSLFFLKTM